MGCKIRTKLIGILSKLEKIEDRSVALYQDNRDVIKVISKQRYKEYVEFLKSNDPLGRPPFVYENYELPQARAHLARCLFIHFRKSHPEFMIDALNILESAVNEMLTDEYEDGTIDVDQIVWGYTDLIVWSWVLHRNSKNSLQYANKGIEFLANVSDEDLSFGVRGKLWFNRWVLLMEIGKSAQAIEECLEQIKHEKLQNKPYTSHSMFYYSYMFLGEVSKQQGDWIKGISYIQEAANYIDLFESHREHEQQNFYKVLDDKSKKPEETFHKLYEIVELVSCLHQAWDFIPLSLDE